MQHWLSLLLAITVSGLLEAYTAQLDNAFIPLVFYSLLCLWVRRIRFQVAACTAILWLPFCLPIPSLQFDSRVLFSSTTVYRRSLRALDKQQDSLHQSVVSLRFSRSYLFIHFKWSQIPASVNSRIFSLYTKFHPIEHIGHQYITEWPHFFFLVFVKLL